MPYLYPSCYKALILSLFWRRTSRGVPDLNALPWLLGDNGWFLIRSHAVAIESKTSREVLRQKKAQDDRTQHCRGGQAIAGRPCLTESPSAKIENSVTAARKSLLRPPALSSGDTIGIVAPAGAVDRAEFAAGEARLRELGDRKST